MLDNEVKNKAQVGKKPLEQGKKTIVDLFEEHAKLLNMMSFISNANFTYNPKDYNLTNQNKFMHQIWNKTFLVAKNKNKVNIKLIANFIVTDVKECTFVYNDKSGKNHTAIM